MARKRITSVEELATLTQREFLAANKRFDHVDGSIAGLRSELRDGLAGLREEMKAGFRTVLEVLRITKEGLDKRRDSHERRITRLEEKIGFK